MRRYFAEMLGTFIMVLCGTGAMVIDSATGGAVSHVGVAMTWGLIVTAMIYSLGHISGCHINPAVTIGFAVAGRFSWREVMPYSIAQLIGALLASGILRLLFLDAPTLGETTPAGSLMQTFVLEFLLTFILMFVIIQVATGSKETGVMAGLAIGIVVLLEAMFAGPITGASMNPARSIAPAFIIGDMQYIWLYTIAPILGSVTAIVCWRVLKESSDA